MRSQKEVESRNKIANLTNVLKNDPYNENKAKVYEQRSEQYELLHQNKEAIVDLSKSLYISPTCDGYYRRGKLYASSQMFYEALMDFEEAQKIYEQEKNQFTENQIKMKTEVQTKLQERVTIKPGKNISPETQNFLQKSTVVLKLPEMKQIVKKYEKSKQFMPEQFNSQFNKLMNKLIDERINNELKLIKQQNNAYNELLALVKRQDEKIKELEKNIQNKAIDYEIIFANEISQSTLSEQNKQKCSIYFFTVISEMEKFYLSAKVLSEFEEKISFEDYEKKSKQKKSKNEGIYAKFIQKVFKLFQKHEDQLERLGQIIKQIPYIGTAFKIIKPSLKICGAIEEMKVESQCQNILNTRPSVSSFNKLSSRVAYQLYKYFKINITTHSQQKNEPVYKKNCIQKLTLDIHHFKRNKMAAKVFSYVKPEQKDAALQMACTHASILMVGIAYGVFIFPTQNGFQQGSWQKQTFEKISQMQQKMLNTQYINEEELNQIKEKLNQKHTNKGCLIF